MPYTMITVMITVSSGGLGSTLRIRLGVFTEGGSEQAYDGLDKTSRDSIRARGTSKTHSSSILAGACRRRGQR
jgi:hypothetical protein